VEGGTSAAASARARCATAAQISTALRAAANAALPVSVHNGGQDWDGRSLRDDTLVIDLSLMNQRSVNARRLDATIAGGVTVGQINEALRGSGLQAVIGNDSAVGMAGFMLGGGYGPLMNRFGMACHNLLSAAVVLPDGNIVNCDATENPELFWALRGGGGNFGVMTSARIRLHAVSTMAVSNMVFAWPDAHAALAPAAPATQGHSCPAACPSGRPPARPARRPEPGSSPPQGVQHPAERLPVDGRTDADPVGARSVDLDRVAQSRRRTPACWIDRDCDRNQCRTAGPQRPLPIAFAPAEELVVVHALTPRHIRDRCARLQRGRDDLPLQFIRPRTVPAPTDTIRVHNLVRGHKPPHPEWRSGETRSAPAM